MNYTKEIQKFTPVPINENIPEDITPLIPHLTKAANIIDKLFLEQVYHKNKELATTLLGEQKELFTIYYGPFNRLEHNKPFIEGHHKPKGANFYPHDITKEEFDTWIQKHPEDKEAFESNYTIIRRKEEQLIALPYNEAYPELKAVAEELTTAATKTTNATLKKYLNTRAEALLNNDYFESDIAWMDLDSKLEIVIGPYEVYEDELHGYKTAFEAFISIKDEAATQEVQQLLEHIEDMEKNLPVDDKHKNTNRGTDSPIVIVNEVYVTGDGRAGIQFTAFNLPNDERVREAKGSKKVMLKNIAHAKYDKCWTPIVKRVTTEQTQQLVNFDGYFTHVLLHEIAHGIGPGTITINGKETTVNKALKETYATIEEAKADIVGAYNAYYLADKGVYTKQFAEHMISSYICGIFRSVRFGINEAHGGANIIAFNHFENKGVVTWKNGKLDLHLDKAREAITELATKLLTIEAHGDYEAAKQLIKEERVIKGEMKTALETLKDIPVDIRPIFPAKYINT